MSGAAGNGRLSGRVAIITGAGTGIGQGCAIAFAKQGADIVIVGRTLDTLQETVEAVKAVGGRIHCVQGSVSDRDTATRAVGEAISTFGRLDIVMNNAHSFTPTLSLEATPEEDFRTHMESGYFGTVYFMQAAFPQLKDKGGSIINVGSIAGTEGHQFFAPYAGAKEAIRALSRVASRDWGQHKIRVNVIVPSSVSKISTEYFAANPEFEKATMAKIPLGYLGDPERDIGGVALFLASDDSRYVTGRTIQVDGGM
jgi:NAD(P)-dependent dehydrogenase (short-subunit alcohol dehydrogenase family)